MTSPLAPRRLLHLHFGKEGGAERFFVSLCGAFQARGVEQRFLIRPGRSWRAAVAGFGSVREVHYPRIWPVRTLLRRWVERQARDWRPDAVIAWMPKAATLIPRTAGPARLVRLGDYPRHVEHFRDADCIVTNTPDIQRRLGELGWSKPMALISNFPRMGEHGGARPDLGLPTGAFVLAAAGRFVKLKGFDILIRAMSEVPGTALLLIGDGEERPALEALAGELGVADRLRITGWVADPMRWLAAADLVCVSSTHETLGNVVLEAWHCGLPVVSTPAPGPRWLIEDGVNGVLAADFTPGALARGIVRIKGDPDLRRAMVAAGATKLSTEFSEDAIVSAYFRTIAQHRRTDP